MFTQTKYSVINSSHAVLFLFTKTTTIILVTKKKAEINVLLSIHTDPLKIK